MKITDEIVDHIAHLARLKFEGEKKVAIKEDMERIISFMDILSELPTDNVEPLIYINGETNIWRNDASETLISAEMAVKNAPEAQENFFSVPRVINLNNK